MRDEREEPLCHFLIPYPSSLIPYSPSSLILPFFLARLDAFDAPGLVNHALEQAADGLGVERAVIRGGHVGDDLGFAFRRIDFQALSFFDMSDLDGALRPFVEEFDQFE